MQVFFSGSSKETPKKNKYYRTIVNKVVELGHEPISLQLQEVDNLLTKKEKKLNTKEKHYLWLNKAIRKSDCIIIEATRDSFKLGHIATLGLNYEKPVLCFSRLKDYSGAILTNRFFSVKYSDISDLEEETTNFIEKVENKYISYRKNIYLTPKLNNKLDSYAKRKNQSASKVLRKLISQL